MQKIKIDQKNITKKEIEELANYFLADNIIAYPTDTIYGLGCLATNTKSIERIEKIKKRKEKQSFIILVKSYCMLKKYCKIDNKQDKFLRTIWSKTKEEIKKTKPTTVILEAQKDMLSENLIFKDGSIAVRMPLQSNFLINLIKKINLPIISTSLNISGEEPINDLEKLDSKFKNIDIAIDAGIIQNNKASKIIDIRDMENIKIIRK